MFFIPVFFHVFFVPPVCPAQFLYALHIVIPSGVPPAHPCLMVDDGERMKDDGSWIHGSRMKLDIGCWLMDHGWMGEAGFWTCPEALEWVVGGCKVVLRSWDASGLFWVKVSGGFGGGFAGRGPENPGMAPEEAPPVPVAGHRGSAACWEGTREPWDGSRRGPCRGPWRGTGADG